MRERAIRKASAIGAIERMKNFEQELLSINGITYDGFAKGVDIDLDNCEEYGTDFILFQIVPKYDVDVRLSNYFQVRNELIEKIIDVCKRNGFCRTTDRIEDYGEHFYIVLKGRKNI